MGTILPPLFHLHERDPAGVVLPLVATVLAVNSVLSHGSKRRLLLALNGFMGLTQAMHHEAVSRIADQITPFTDGINGGASRGGKNAAFELHPISRC